MKILFINPPFLDKFSRSQRSPGVTKGGTLYFPYWLAYAAGWAEKNGFEVNILDCTAKHYSADEISGIIRSYDPSLLVVDTSTPSIYNDVEFADSLKELIPGSYVVLVGTHPSALPEETLKLSNGNVDAIAVEEYDLTLTELAEAIKKGLPPDNVAGLYLRGGLTAKREYIQDLDAFPFVSSIYKKYLRISDYYFAAADHPMVMVMTGRGCPYGCFFCLYPQTMHGKRYRYRTAGNILEEFRYIKKELPEVREVVLEDDTFTADIKRVREFCELLIKDGNRLKWSCNARVNIDLDTMKLMKKAKCRLLIVGFESGSQKVLDGMKKKIKLEDSIKFADTAKSAGLLVHGCFMVGNPGETKETMKQTLEFAERLDCDSAQFYPLYVYPGTEAFSWAKEQGFIQKGINYKDWVNKAGRHMPVIDLPGLSAKEMLDFCDKAYMKFHLRPAYLLKKLLQLVSSPSEGIRSLRSAFKFFGGIINGR
jgi:radical SAM superfamily enzyme YgiQ (UPF0313 family)